ncbi:unnamed protein product [Rhodiola kirilowii]
MAFQLSPSLKLLLLQILMTLLIVAAAETEQLYNNASLVGRPATRCNLFQGKWVFDGSSNPLYDSSTCPFISGEFDCIKFGRPDKQFLKYQWHPQSCNLPRFNGLDFLRRWRGKKIMFVGDSLSLNMWESLSCMIHSSVPNVRNSLVRRDSLSSVSFLDYGVTISMFRTPYLVDIVRGPKGRILELGSIQGGKVWKDADMLIFNSWHWWTHTGSAQAWDYMQDGAGTYKDIDRLTAFYKGLSTWANWVDLNIDPKKTKVFFQGVSPTHYQGREWNQPSKSCTGEQQPLSGSAYPAGAPEASAIVNKVLSSMKKHVYLLDITTLSQLRKDAHPSGYGGGGGTDCSHWCLPGLPDTWNQLLYAALLM